MIYPSKLKMVLGLLCCLPLGSRAALPSDVEGLIETFFKPAEMENVSLSPDGTTIAYQSTFKGAKTLATIDAVTLKRIGYIGGDPGLGIHNYHWTGNDRLVYSLARWNIYLEEFILTNRALTSRRPMAARTFPNLIDSLPYVKGGVLLGVPRGDPLYQDVLKLLLDAPQEETELVAQNPGDFIDWKADLNGVVRIGYKKQPNGSWEIHHRAKPSEPWEKLALPPKTHVASFNPAGDIMLVRFPRERGLQAFQAFDLKSNALIGEPFGDAVYDVAGTTLRDSQSREIVGYAYQADRPKFLWFDADYARLHEAVRKSNPSRVPWFHGVTANNEMLISSGSDVQPEIYSLLDLKTMKSRVLKKSRAWIDPADLQPMETVRFPATDGTTLHGLLVKPAGHSKPGPMILVIHGGPGTRDLWGFDPQAQFFAALGYTVLQVNYRGSTGYGEDYQLKTMLQTFQLSVEDVAAAARWAVTAGLADPKRIGVYGGSFGGYIALGCATRASDLFACALGFAGVYDWELQFRRDVENGGSFFDWDKERWGDAKHHPEKFRPFSPAKFADVVRCPVWLAHGAADRRVAIEQTKQMSAALKKAGKNVEVHLDTWGVHGLVDPEKRQEYYRSVAAFLAKHLPRAAN